MASPIRWDNINAPNLGEAARPLELARASFNDAFAGLRGTLQEREAIDTANFQNTKTNNTNALLDAVARYGSVDELKAGRGALDQMRAGFGNQIDAAAVRGAYDQRMAGLQDQAQKNIAYQGVMRNEATAPLVDQLRSAIMNKDAKAQEAARAGLSAAGYRDFAVQDAFADEYNRELVLRGQGDQKFSLDQDKGKQDILASKASIANQERMANIAAQNASTNRFEAETNRDRVAIAKADHRLNLEAKNQDALNKKYDRLMGIDSYTLDSVDGMKTVTDTINKMPIDDKQKQSLLRAAGKLGESRVPLLDESGKAITDAAGKPMMTGVAVSDALQSILNSKDDRWFTGKWMNNNSTQGEDILKEAVKRASSSGSALKAGQREAIRQSVIQDIETLRRRQQDGSVTNSFNVTGSKDNVEEAVKKLRSR